MPVILPYCDPLESIRDLHENHIDFKYKLQFSDTNIPPLVRSVQILQPRLSNQFLLLIT